MIFSPGEEARPRHLNAGVFDSFVLLYNLSMNKRAKKRLKEAMEKDNAERAKIRQEQNPSSSKGQQERRGFTSKPAKKRG
jgi:hypothetical protein